MLNCIKKSIKITGNRKNIAKISSGTIIGQGISIISLPIITRIYGAEIIGKWALLYSIAIVINSFSDLGLTNSIMIEKEEAIETNYKVTSTLSVLMSIISSFIVTLSIYYFDAIEMHLLFFFIFLTLLSFTLQQIEICYTWLNRYKNYNILMKNPIISNSVFGISSILFGILGFTKYGYFIAYIFAQCITLWNMKHNLPRIMFTKNINDFVYIIKKNKRFVMYQTPTNIIARFKGQLPTFLIKTFWNTEMLGYYSITVKVLQIPATFLAKAIGRIFFQLTSRMKIEGSNIGSYVLRNLLRNMKIAIIPMILLMGFGDVATIIFLGNDWAIAGDFIRILVLQYYFVFLMMTMQGLSITLEKQNYAMISSISQAAGYLVGALIGRYIFNSIYLALILMSFFFILIQIIYFSSLFIVMGIPWKNYIYSAITSVVIIVTVAFILRLIFDHFGFIVAIYKLIGI